MRGLSLILCLVSPSDAHVAAASRRWKAHRVNDAGELARAAARNNAGWCDRICRLHGLAGTYHDGAWSVAHRPPPLYPDAVTLDPGADVDAILGAIDASPGCGVKDSFACLDLTSAGFRVLFEARWIHRPAGAPPPEPSGRMRWSEVREAAELRSWERAWGGDDGLTGIFLPDLLEDDAVLVVAGYRDASIVAGAIASRDADVVGLSNVFSVTGDLDDTWRGALAAIATHVGEAPLVGYERGDDLEAARRCGFTALGPLRVWDATAGAPEA